MQSTRIKFGQLWASFQDYCQFIGMIVNVRRRPVAGSQYVDYEFVGFWIGILGTQKTFWLSKEFIESRCELVQDVNDT